MRPAQEGRFSAGCVRPAVVKEREAMCSDSSEDEPLSNRLLTGPAKKKKKA